MNEEVMSKLMEEISSVEDVIQTMNVDTVEYERAVNRLDTLWKMALDVEKSNSNAREQSEIRLSNEMIEKEKLEEAKKDRKWRVGIGIGGLVLSGVLYTANALIGYSIEENGCIASPTLKTVSGNINKFFEKKNK